MVLVSNVSLIGINQTSDSYSIADLHIFYCFIPNTSSLRSQRSRTRSSSTTKGTFRVRWSKRRTTALPYWTSSTGERSTRPGSWAAGGSSTSIPTTRVASTCWRKAITASPQTGVPSAPPCSPSEKWLSKPDPTWGPSLALWVTHTVHNVKTAWVPIKLKNTTSSTCLLLGVLI